MAQHRNICQACLNDMQYGLPVGVRDKLLREGQLNNNMMVCMMDSYTLVHPYYMIWFQIFRYHVLLLKIYFLISAWAAANLAIGTL